MCRRLLQDGDNEARDLWSARSVEVSNRLSSHMVERVSQALAQYDYDAALQLLMDDTTQSQ